MVGPEPPPFGGIWSVMDSIMRSDLAREYRFDHFPKGEGFPPGVNGPLARNLFRVQRFISFYKKIGSKKYAFVHIQSSDGAFLGTVIFMAIARLSRLPILLHQHGTHWGYFYGDAPLLEKAYTRLGLLLPKRVIVLFQAWAAHIKKLSPRIQVRVLRNLIHEADHVDPGRVQALRNELGLQAGDFVVVSVGSVGRRKGSFDIVAATPEVSAQDPSIRFVLVGGEEHPGEMDELRAVVEFKNAGSLVHCTGEVAPSRVPEYLAVADVFILPSSVEGMPISILEAMRSSLPIITTAVSGIPEVIEHDRSGVFIKPGSPPEIARAVLRLRRDEALRTRLGHAARVVFDERFAFSRGIEEIRRLYAEMAE